MTKFLEVEDVARICHEANRAYCLSLGDHSQPLWADAPEWQRKSAITGVEFHLRNLDATDAASHESWLKEKEADGWKYGPVKIPEKKEHPCYVPFYKLPVEQKVKDRLFRKTVDALRGYVKGEWPLRTSDEEFRHNLTQGIRGFNVTEGPDATRAVVTEILEKELSMWADEPCKPAEAE